MIAFPAILVRPAEKAGINVPPDIENYDSEEFPHWHVYLLMQIGATIPCPGAHWINADTIAAIPKEKLIYMTYQDLIDEGFLS